MSGLRLLEGSDVVVRVLGQASAGAVTVPPVEPVFVTTSRLTVAYRAWGEVAAPLMVLLHAYVPAQPCHGSRAQKSSPPGDWVPHLPQRPTPP